MEQVEYALELARGGFKVFPVRGKIPAVKWKTVATSNEKEVGHLWEEYPDANIGLACGNGLVVIDFDDPDCEAAQWLADKLPPTLTCRTGRGLHRYYIHPESARLRNLQLAGVDLRTDGGLVVGPGSLHSNGTRYEWLDDTVEMAELPGEVFDYLLSARKKEAAPFVKGEGGVAKGQRHTFLLQETWRLACTTKLDLAELVQVTKATVVPKCDDPGSISDYEIEEACRGALEKRNTYAIPISQLTEKGLADKFVDYYGNTVVALGGKDWKRFDPESGLWEREGGPVNLVEPIRDAVYRAVVDTANENEKVIEAANGFYKSSGTYRFAEAVTKFVAPKIEVSEGEFIIPANTLPFENGLYNLRTGKFRGFRAGDFVQETIRARYTENADCPKWMETVNYLSRGDLEVIRYLQQVCGFLISSDTIRGIFYFIGVPGSGKNTLVCTLNDILGDALAGTASKTLIHVGRNDDDEQQMRRNLALVGKRFVWIDETNNRDVVDTQKFKSIASTDTMLKARRLRHDAFDFLNKAKVVVMSNHAPRIDPDDTAAWERVRYVPFLEAIPTHVRRADFAEELREEADGIMAWCIQGYNDYREAGDFTVPAVVEQDVVEWKAEHNPLVEFVESVCEFGDDRETTIATLYQVYETWRSNQALGIEGSFNGSREFAKSLRQHCGSRVGSRRSSSQRYITGIGVTDGIIVR